MLSLRLWRTIAEADIHDPIFRRVSQIQKPAPRSAPSLKNDRGCSGWSRRLRWR